MLVLVLFQMGIGLGFLLWVGMFLLFLRLFWGLLFVRRCSFLLLRMRFVVCLFHIIKMFK